jgi:hypothetical protein
MNNSFQNINFKKFKRREETKMIIEVSTTNTKRKKSLFFALTRDEKSVNASKLKKN